MGSGRGVAAAGPDCQPRRHTRSDQGEAEKTGTALCKDDTETHEVVLFCMLHVKLILCQLSLDKRKS